MTSEGLGLGSAQEAAAQPEAVSVNGGGEAPATLTAASSPVVLGGTDTTGARGGAVRGVEATTTAPPAQRVWTVPLLFTTPPLTLNQRKHWTYRARISREIHAQVGWQVKRLKIPALPCPVVTLHYAPCDRRRRDADNLIATSKVCVDGLVLAAVLADDTPAHVDHRMPVIAPPEKPARMWLEIVAADV